MPLIIDSPVPPSMPLSTIAASTIIDKAAILLTDEGNDRWTRTELLMWLNEGQKAIVQIVPSANNKIGTMKLQPGARQMIPADGWLLLGITRNLGTDSTTPGPMIQLVERDILDRFRPNWYADTPSSVTQNYMFSLQDQPSFYVFPPSTGSNYVEINYSFLPKDVALESDAIKVRDVYAVALLDYMMYRAFMKDAEASPGSQLAATYYQSFLNLIGAKSQGEIENNPNMKLGPMNPSARGGAK